MLWPIETDDDRSRSQGRVPAAPRSNAIPSGLADHLRDMLPGRRIVLEGDSDYAGAAKVFNPLLSLRPWVIVYCVAEQDVRICLEAARRYKIAFRIRASGHSFVGYSTLDDGMIIDVRGLNNLRIDIARTKAHAEAGCTLGDISKALQARGLHLPLGGAAVAVSGYLQGGGFGTTSRSFGMNCDSVAEMRVMLADGRVVVATDSQNYDLWWAMRGGTGGNFGVLLEATYDVRRAQIVMATLAWPAGTPSEIARAARALATLQQVLPTAGKALNVTADLRRWATSQNGPVTDPWLVMMVSYAGAKADMDAALKPLLDIPGNVGSTGFPGKISPFVRASRFVSNDLQETDWQKLLDQYLSLSNATSTLTIEACGGAINDYPIEESAFIHRGAAFNIYVTGFWQAGNHADEQKVRHYLEKWSEIVEPFWNGLIYQNFPDAALATYPVHYWGRSWPALAAVKHKYDPGGFFSFPQAVDRGAPPAPAWPHKVVDWLARPIQF